jgi:hypothetical protein
MKIHLSKTILFLLILFLKKEKNPDLEKIVLFI